MTEATLPLDVDLHGVAETLLIPLAIRAYGGARFPRLGFHDPASEAAARRLRFDPQRYLVDRSIVYGVLRRTELFTAWAGDFLRRHPQGLGVGLGAGLSPYAARLDADRSSRGAVSWVDVDLAPVTALRRSVMPPGAASQRVAVGSVLDGSWRAAVPNDRPAVFICEGVVNYLEAEQVTAFLRDWASYVHPQSELLMDAACWLVAGTARYHPMLRHFDAEFRWGIRRRRDLTTPHPRLELRVEQVVMEGRNPFHWALWTTFRTVFRVPFYAVYRLGLKDNNG